MTTSAIEVEGLWKEYVVELASPRHDTFYDVVTSWITAPIQRLRSLAGRVEEAERFWALRDVQFKVGDGEVLGVIGRNGAGKSTLLKVLTRITAPTLGRITMRGRVASLLEVGTGFHPELSGRENIFLNGAIMGMTRREVQQKFGEIVAFAEVEKFIDTPVKRYSSGMYVRLAFAVASHLEADVLLVDEVLAVGDAAFQRKSINRMSDVARRGRTVLFVSHNLGAVRNLCTRALVLQQGRLVFDGPVREGLTLYEQTFAAPGAEINAAHFQGTFGERLRIEQLVCRQRGEIVDVIDPLTEFEIELRGTALQFFPVVELKISFFREGAFIGSCHDTAGEAAMQEGPFTSRIAIPGDVFRPGRYSVGIGAAGSIGSWMWGSDVAALDFSDERGGRSAERTDGVLAIPHRGERIQGS